MVEATQHKQWRSWVWSPEVAKHGLTRAALKRKLEEVKGLLLLFERAMFKCKSTCSYESIVSSKKKKLAQFTVEHRKPSESITGGSI